MKLLEVLNTSVCCATEKKRKGERVTGEVESLGFHFSAFGGILCRSRVIRLREGLTAFLSPVLACESMEALRGLGHRLCPLFCSFQLSGWLPKVRWRRSSSFGFLVTGVSDWFLLFCGAETLREARKEGCETQDAPMRPSLVAQKHFPIKNLFLVDGTPACPGTEFESCHFREQAKETAGCLQT